MAHSDLPPDAALRITRWCWPKTTNAKRESDYAEKDIAIGRQMHRDWPLIHAAELVLIKRGLAEEYGRTLCYELLGVVATDPPELVALMLFVDVATLATAPLDARVRAMLAVIQKQEAKK